jgi:hypothetical protein
VSEGSITFLVGTTEYAVDLGGNIDTEAEAKKAEEELSLPARVPRQRGQEAQQRTVRSWRSASSAGERAQEEGGRRSEDQGVGGAAHGFEIDRKLPAGSELPSLHRPRPHICRHRHRFQRRAPAHRRSDRAGRPSHHQEADTGTRADPLGRGRVRQRCDRERQSAIPHQELEGLPPAHGGLRRAATCGAAPPAPCAKRRTATRSERGWRSRAAYTSK